MRTNQMDMNPEDRKIITLIKRGAMIGVSAVALTIGGCNSFYSVDQGERAVHTRMGALVGVTEPGMRFKFPFIDGVKRISVRAETIKWEQTKEADYRMESYSKDQQPAHISMTLTWSLPADEKSIAAIFTTYGSREGLRQAVVLPKTVEATKNIFGGYDAVTVIQQRAKFNVDVANQVNELTKGYPVNITGIQVQDISFSDAYEEAVEQRMMAQVNVQKKEQEKQTAQIDADMQVIKAEARSKEITLVGNAEADAIRARGNALAQSPKLVELTAAEKWNGILPTTMVPGSAVPFISVK